MPRTIVHVGRKIRVALDEETLADGTVIRRDVVLHPGAVAVIPVIDAEHICLLRNRRPIFDQVLWEIPAGTLEPGEAPDHAAVRELIEETGYRAGRWTKLSQVYPSPGVLSEVMHLYLAEDLTPGPHRPEQDEELHPETVRLADALGWIFDGTIHDAKTILGLLWLNRIRPLV